MITDVRAEMVCDKCKASYTFVASTLTGVRGVRTKARRHGWICNGKDYCPNCTPNIAKEKL